MATTAERMARVWESPPGISKWVATVDHKAIGRRYLVTAFTFFCLAGIGALLMRTQLIQPNMGVLSPERYNQIFSMHGTTMIFLFATPILSGFGNFLVPLMIGARDMAFPRLNALSYWIFLFSGLFLWSSFLFGAVPDGGWFSYVPLTSAQFSPGHGIDFYTLGLIFLSISTTAGAVNFIVTIFKMRAPGMSVNRIPLFIWSVLTISFALIFALPPLTIANVFLEMDRQIGTHFFDPASGGNPLLWQHLFWVFGHPDVYIIFLPAVGIVSTVIPTFSRRPITAYILIVLATVATGIISFGVWVHHMFAVGLPPLSMTFFSAASMVIAVPAGIQVFAWIATVWNGRPVFKTPFLFALGFIVLFVIGGVTGVMFAAVPFDQQITDSYFVVAHFHYVLVGGAVFPIFAGLYYWFPKITGRMYDERLGVWSFWLMFVGFNLAFFPMHVSGLLGMPRRVYTYPSDLGWGSWNLASTIGAYVLGIGILVFLVNAVVSMRQGEPAGDNPWQAGTLEWSVSSPPPPYNFLTIPTVRGAEPLWEQASLAPSAVGGELTQPVGEQRETLGTSILDSQPEEILRMPGESTWPILLAFSFLVLFIGLIVPYWLVAALGAAAALLSVAGWLWPTQEARP